MNRCCKRKTQASPCRVVFMCTYCLWIFSDETRTGAVGAHCNVLNVYWHLLEMTGSHVGCGKYGENHTAHHRDGCCMDNTGAACALNVCCTIYMIINMQYFCNSIYSWQQGYVMHESSLNTEACHMTHSWQVVVCASHATQCINIDMPYGTMHVLCHELTMRDHVHVVYVYVLSHRA